MDRLLYRPEEAAQALGLSRATVYELMRRGEISSLKIGASRRITGDALEAEERGVIEPAERAAGDV